MRVTNNIRQHSNAADQQLNAKAADQQHLSTLLPSNVGGTSLLISNGGKSRLLGSNIPMLQLNRKAADKQHVSTLLLSTLVEHHCWSAMGARLGYLAVTAQCCWTAAEYKKAADQQHVSTLLPSNVGGTIADQHPWLIITTNSKTHDNLREDIIGAWQDGKVDSEHLPGSW